MATIATSCCLNACPPPSTTTQTNTKTKPNNIRFLGCTEGSDRNWGSQCVIGMACAILQLQMVNPSVAEQMPLSVQAVVDYQSGTKWSDKRTCPPWKLNSLETIVPENLPRPSARRRWESVGHHDPTRNAPDLAVKVVGRGGVNCFSM
ncbi:hypothetical protein K2173_026039 [Erythroxylum novogranatense]|uniref:Uncharacterized protein n=1 Tax=Erythroxylum novogranatense TaxID=1862640 RepID=A0AAV8SI06_9ROSI|nr:hypothetical protein K2173_026039 [Erythroxylum novogranatense]